MAKGDQINIRPHFKKEGDKLPCEAAVGDLYVFTPLNDGDPDPTPQGLASMWFCTKGSDVGGENRPAIWARLQFDGVITCALPPPKPPQSRPILKEG